MSAIFPPVSSLIVSWTIPCKTVFFFVADIEQQAQDLFLRLVKEYTEKENVTEKLKAENQLEWVGKMNNIRSGAVEIIDVELICV